MSPEEQPITAQEQLAELVRLGAGQAVIDGFRRANGLPTPEPAPVVIRIRVAALAPRPRATRKPRKKTTPRHSAAVASRVRERFDLPEIYDNE